MARPAQGDPMSACPHCHIYKGLWSPLIRSKDNIYICQSDVSHRFSRDRDGNYRAVEQQNN